MSNTSVFSPGNTALITGSASGIGLAVAQLCRSYGMHLALVDNDESPLSNAKQSLREKNPEISSNPRIETYLTDVSELDQWASLKDKVVSEFGGVDFLMLNAGIGRRGNWEDHDYFQKIISTNLFGVINGINTFLPLLHPTSHTQATTPSTSDNPKTDKPTAIVITGSKQGITNPPGNPAYNASKAAVKALAEHLSFDLKDTSTTVHLLVPGWTFTGLTGGAPNGSTIKPAGAWSPTQVAAYLFDGISAGKFYIICPDNDVTEEMDKKRMLWTVGDVVQGRQPLSRWREEYKQEAETWMDKQQV